MEWTLEHESTVQSLAAWGFENCILTDKGWAPGTFQFTHSGAAFDAAPLFAEDDEITLYLDGVKKFIGFITQTPTHTGESEDQSYVAENLLGDMARRTYGQTWQNVSGGIIGDGFTSRAVLFDDGGAAQNVALSLAAIVNAAAAAGVSVQMGTAANLTVSPRKLDVKCMTFLEVLRAACVYSPDVVPQVDYTTEGAPTLNFIRRGDASAHNLAVIETADDFRIAPLYDQKIAGVFLVYETRGTVEGVSYLSLSYDIYPEGTAATDRRVLFSVMQLQGASQGMSQTTVQEITVATVTEEDMDWWKTRVPYLNDANPEATLTDVTVKNEEGGDETVAKELRSGVIYPWMGGTTKVVVIRGIFNGLINGEPVLNQAITIKMVSTTLGSGEYSNSVNSSPSSSSPAETPPGGVAEHLYSALNPLQWSGSHVLIGEECNASIRAGDVANFTGTANDAWLTANAQIQVVESNLDLGTTRIEFGRAEYLAPQDYTQLLREQRQQRDGNSSGTKNSGESASSNLVQQGPTWTPDTSVTLGAPEAIHPWKMSKVGLTGNVFKVQGGTYDGVTIAAQTVDIGATRPRYVYIPCEWTVTPWADKFPATVERTGTPTIASATTAPDVSTVIPTGVTTWNHMLAQVNADETITQWENDNCLPTWEDTGAMDASAKLKSI